MKWTVDEIKKVASKCRYRSELRKEYQGAAVAAKRFGIYEEICSHMKPMGNRFLRTIYSIEFEDKSVYVGLTFNFEQRKKDHIKKPSNKFVENKIKNGINYKFIDFNKSLPPNDALLLENKTLQDYKNGGWEIINIMPTGKGASLGGHISKYNKRTLQEIANTCKSRTEFANKNRSAYSVARKTGLLNKICTHMPKRILRKSKWTKKLILKEAKKYKTRTEFQIKSRTAHLWAKRLGVYDKACSEMYDYRIWNKKTILKEALKFKYISDFQKCSGGAYEACGKLKLRKQAYAHMIEKPNSGRFKSKANSLK